MEETTNNSMLQYRFEPDHAAQNISTRSCEENMTCVLADMLPSSQGRILELSACIRNVCPGKRTAVAVSVHELDENNVEHARGMKCMTMPAHHERSCRDVMLQGIRFVLPEDISLAGNCPSGSSCARRRFVVRTLAHYVDMDSECGCDD